MVKLSLTGLLIFVAGVLGAAQTCTGPPANDETLEIIKTFEGFVSKPAPDPIGLPTVGYGHLCKEKHCSEVGHRFPITRAEGTKLLKDDLQTPQNCLTMYTNDKVKLNANQYGALVSWVFNVGCANLHKSSLLGRLNAGNNPDTVAAEELPKWNIAGGKILPGLTRRRAAELKLFRTPNSQPALPAAC